MYRASCGAIPWCPAHTMGGPRHVVLKCTLTERCMQTPQAAPLVRKPAVKLRPFFWNKLPWKPDHIWARVPAGRIARPELITSGHWQMP